MRRARHRRPFHGCRQWLRWSPQILGYPFPNIEALASKFGGDSTSVSGRRLPAHLFLDFPTRSYHRLRFSVISLSLCCSGWHGTVVAVLPAGACSTSSTSTPSVAPLACVTPASGGSFSIAHKSTSQILQIWGHSFTTFWLASSVSGGVVNATMSTTSVPYRLRRGITGSGSKATVPFRLTPSFIYLWILLTC